MITVGTAASFSEKRELNLLCSKARQMRIIEISTIVFFKLL